MKKQFFFIIFLLANFFGFSQTYTRYWVAFKDKNSSPYSIGNPQQFLSQRAINRRTLHSFPVTAQDLPVNPSYISQVQATGAVILSRSRWFNGVVVRITNPSQVAAITALSCVQTNKPVARILPMRKTVKVENDELSSRKNFAIQTTGRFNYGGAYNQIHQLNGECLHDQFYDGTGMQIAEIDDGFSNANVISIFDSLWVQNRMIGKHNFFSGDTTDLYAIGGHGTEVLSCMAAFKNGSMVGTAPYAKYYLLRSEIDSTEKIMEEYSWVSAIEYADSAGADVATSSLGYSIFPNDPSMDHTWADLDGKTSVASLSATMAARRGMIVCVAAGNEGGSTWQKITIPSDADSIMAVGAVTNTGNYAGFSSTGFSADGRVKPDVMAQGQNATLISTNGNVISGSGTSFATPILAGMTACLWQGNPTKTNMQVIDAIKQSASRYTTPDSIMGYGIPDFCLADQILKGNIGTQVYVYSTFFEDKPSVFISGNRDMNLTIELFDINGRRLVNSPAKILKDNGFKQAIEIPETSNLPAGMYLIKITADDGQRWVTKIIKS